MRANRKSWLAEPIIYGHNLRRKIIKFIQDEFPGFDNHIKISFMDKKILSNMASVSFNVCSAQTHLIRKLIYFANTTHGY